MEEDEVVVVGFGGGTLLLELELETDVLIDVEVVNSSVHDVLTLLLDDAGLGGAVEEEVETGGV